MKRILSMTAALLCSAGAFAQYTNVLENGTNLTVNTAWTNDTVWVGQSTSSNELLVVSGGEITSTNAYVGADSNANDNVVSVIGGRWDIEDTLVIGPGSSNAVSVGGGGAVSAGSLLMYTNNSLNLNRGGTFAISTNFDASMDGFNWNAGGHLSVGGELTGMTMVSNSVYLDNARMLTLNGGSWNPGGDMLVSGSSNTLSIVNGGGVTNDNGFVGYGTSNLNNAVEVSGAGSVWANNGSLYIGSTNGSTGNVVMVSDGGRVFADDLIIADGNRFSLNSAGLLSIDGDFILSLQSNLVWNSGGLLSLSGSLSGLSTTSLVVNGVTNDYAYIDGGHDIRLDGGSLQLGTTNLIIGYNSSNSDLSITNGAGVVNAVGYIGWGGTSANNSVLVSGSGSVWTNSGGELYVGAYWSGTNVVSAGAGNALVIADGGWVNVGETATNLAGVSMLVASTNGAQLAVGRGSVEMDGSLQLGLSTNLTGTAIIRSGGTLSVEDLQIADGSLLDLQSGGTFATAGGFDRSMTGFEWGEESHLSVGGVLSGMDSTNGSYYLDGGRDLTLAGGSWNELSGNDLIVGYNGSDSILTVSGSNGILDSANGYIGWGTNSANNTVVVKDDGVWNNGGDLWAGHDGSGNALSVSSGGTVDAAGNGYVGNTDASDNTVRVEGSNSIWSVAGDMFVGGAANSVNNRLSAADEGRVEVGGSLTLRSGNALELDTGGAVSIGSSMAVYSNATVSGTGTLSFGETNAVLAFYGDNIGLSTGIVFNAHSNYANRVSVYGGTFAVTSNALPYVNFQTLSMSNSILNGTGVLNAFETVALTGGRIDPAGEDTGRLELTGAVSFDGTTYRAQVISNQWDELVFSGTNTVDLASASAAVFVPYIPTTTNDIIILTANGLTNRFAATNMDVRPLLYDGELLVSGSEVQVVLVPVEGETISSTLGYAETESVRAGFNGMKNMVFARTKQLRRNLVATAHAIPNEVLLMTNTNAPAGALGPGDQNTIFDMHVWMQHYSGKGDYDRNGVSDSFALYNNGTTIGADRLVGEALTVGLNYTYARSAARANNRDQLDTETYWFGAYGEWVGVDGLYFDAIAGYGFTSFDSQRFAENYHGMASYNGHAFGAAADLGQYYYSGENVALAPYLGLHALTMKSESHQELEDAGSAIRVGEVDHSWVESAIGIKVRHRFDTPVGRFQTTGFAEWTYDFIQDEVYASLSSGNLAAVNAATISPDESGINVGLGYSWICTEYMEIGVGYNGRFSDGYEDHSASAMLDVMF